MSNQLSIERGNSYLDSITAAQGRGVPTDVSLAQHVASSASEAVLASQVWREPSPICAVLPPVMAFDPDVLLA